MRTIWLIRHGESTISAGLPFTSFAQAPLTDLGFQQAGSLARYFIEPPDLVVTSPFLRTQQTAQPLLDRFTHLERVEWPIQEYTYMTFPTNDATTKHSLKTENDLYWQQCDPLHQAGPEAESFTMFIHRVDACLYQLQQRQELFSVLFTHELFMAACVWRIMADPVNLTPQAMQHFQSFSYWLRLSHCSIFQLGYTDRFWIGKIITLDSTAL